MLKLELFFNINILHNTFGAASMCLLALNLHNNLLEIDCEIFSMVIHSLNPLIQEGQLLFLVKECAQVLVNRLED